MGVIFTRAPWWDEGLFSDPAHNLAEHGYLGFTFLNGRGHPMVREFEAFDRYTYWMLPLYLVALAGWIKVFGFSFITGRLLSLLCGVGMIAAACYLAWRLTKSRLATVLTAVFLCTDYAIVLSSATARMDMMSAVFGFGGIAAYLYFRERNLQLAAFLGGCGVMGAFLCHPTGAMHTGGLLLIALYFDRKRLNWKVIASGAAPYLLFPAAWSMYIAQAPDVFRSQFRAHTAYRIGGLHSPLHAILVDVSKRYLLHYLPGVPGSPYRLKVLIILVYWAGILVAVFVPAIRRAPGVWLLLMLSALYYCELAVLDSDALFPHYMIHPITIWAILLAAVTSIALRKKLIPPPVIAALLFGFIALQLSGNIIKIHNNTYRNEWLPAIAFIEQHTNENSIVMGPSQLQFGIKDRKLVDDARLGGLSGIHPDIIMLDYIHDAPLIFEGREPDMVAYTSDVLKKRFYRAAVFGEYRIYLPRTEAHDENPSVAGQSRGFATSANGVPTAGGAASSCQ